MCTVLDLLTDIAKCTFLEEEISGNDLGRMEAQYFFSFALSLTMTSFLKGSGRRCGISYEASFFDGMAGVRQLPA